ncbi:uncharacterized protein LOC129758342 isoform X2 [Uranotaenia lowii]|uniref:uncharacterized protein LOC129758342 isoform X2 n=1 Tax=Uranotaenia lowii TaxID=190385 RepID=UPI002478B6D5|nr:uncharacterized protein LOC129758342 isoform X2 [Uranotaenia lowii]
MFLCFSGIIDRAKPCHVVMTDCVKISRGKYAKGFPFFICDLETICAPFGDDDAGNKLWANLGVEMVTRRGLSEAPFEDTLAYRKRGDRIDVSSQHRNFAILARVPEEDVEFPAFIPRIRHVPENSNHIEIIVLELFSRTLPTRVQ